MQVGGGDPLVALAGQGGPELQVVAVAGAAEHHHRAGVVQDRRGVVLAPPGQQLRPGLEGGQDRHPAPAHVRGPRLERHRGDQRGLVQGQGQRRVQPAARLVGGQAAGLPGDVPGQRADQRRGLGLLRAEQEHRRPLGEQLGDVERRGPGAAAAAAAGWVSQPSAGMTVEVIEVRVRSLVVTNCSGVLLERRHPGAAQQRRHLPGGPLGVGHPAQHVAHRPAAERGGVQQRGQHPAGLGVPELPIPTTAAGAAAVGGEHVGGPLRRGHRVGAAGQRVEGDRRRQPGQADRVEHEHRPPPRPQRRAQLVAGRCGCEVTSTAPGASRTRPASQPVLPVRGPPKTSVTSSIEDHTVCQPGAAQPHRHLRRPAAATAATGTARPATGAPCAARRRIAARRGVRGRCPAWRRPRPCGGSGRSTAPPARPTAPTDSTRQTPHRGEHQVGRPGQLAGQRPRRQRGADGEGERSRRGRRGATTPSRRGRARRGSPPCRS